MEPVITVAQAAEWDARSREPVTALMQRAGLAVAIAASELGAGYGKRVAVLAGPGNNGGDGYVAARYLARRGAAVEVIALSEPRSDACRSAAGQAAASGVTVNPWRSPKEASLPDLLIDALFGAGFRGALPDEVAPWTTVTAPVLAVDVPSGLDATTGAIEGASFRAVRTVTFGALKVGHLLGVGPEVSGTVTVADIGLTPGPSEFWVCHSTDAARPSRARTGHKWSVGSVMLVGGSPGLTGALWLAARSALSAGVGAVRAVLPAGLERSFPSPELMTLAVGAGDRLQAEDAREILKASERFDVLVVGPGLGVGQTGLVTAIVEGRKGPLVVDADGLGAITDPAVLTQRPGPTVLTPHAGEFRKLTGTDAGYR
ncbi:MAG TPA: NAD(P)H-hydrate epimerase, partial [Acidimicrobiia bacterium]